MAFTGFSAAGVDLLSLNRLQNSKDFYEEHKAEIKKLAITPFYELIEQMTPVMQQIDEQFVTVPSRMVSRVRPRHPIHQGQDALPREYVAFLPQSAPSA